MTDASGGSQALWPCVACLGLNETRFQLCPACEAFARRLRERAGLPLRLVTTLVVKEEPDD